MSHLHNGPPVIEHGFSLLASHSYPLAAINEADLGQLLPSLLLHKVAMESRIHVVTRLTC